MLEKDVHGTLLLACEGINGTITGSREGIDAVKAWIASDDRFEGVDYKESFVEFQPFKRTKVKLKKERHDGVKVSTRNASWVPT